jgi:hypothetical protein
MRTVPFLGKGSGIIFDRILNLSRVVLGVCGGDNAASSAGLQGL